MSLEDGTLLELEYTCDLALALLYVFFTKAENLSMKEHGAPLYDHVS